MKHHLLYLTITFLLSQPVFSQTAPDFTVFDPDGFQHDLYEDYLDQGKTVLIEVFFTNCPPCNSIAPYMQPLYEEWGAGAYDVEFFELSNKSYDDNENINDFTWLFGITFPSIGAEGGSLDAVQPYQDGTFGPFFGTPTFAVIAPDGTVNYNVRGPNNQATIDAIDAALAATGAMKPMEDPTPDSVIISGQAHLYFNNSGIANAMVKIYNISDPEQTLASGLTNNNGEFNLIIDTTGLDLSQYALTVVKENSPSNGISGADLLLIRKHVLTIAEFDKPQELIAADANGNADISTLDLVRLLKITLGLNEEHFPDGKSWLFYSSSGNLNSPGDLPPLESVSLETAMAPGANNTFKGIKKGDLNNSVNPLD